MKNFNNSIKYQKHIKYSKVCIYSDNVMTQTTLVNWLNVTSEPQELWTKSSCHGTGLVDIPEVI